MESLSYSNLNGGRGDGEGEGGGEGRLRETWELRNSEFFLLAFLFIKVLIKFGKNL